MALAGLKVIEFGGLAPGPFAGLVLADNGATVIRVDKPGVSSSDVLCRGKRSIAVDSKVARGRDLLEKLISSADVVIDPFRPGVMERLGLGPEVFLGNRGLNPRLVYARIVGFPRTGPYKDMAGHDLNYAALSGVLSLLPGIPKPAFPLNILADFAGGGLICATGILLALLEREKSGKGQVVNTDMVSGARYVSMFPLIHGLNPESPMMGGGNRGSNLLDGGAPFYNLYACKDGGWMSVGCLEPQFFQPFLTLFLKSIPADLSVEGWKPTLSSQFYRDEWPRFFAFLEKGFMTNTKEYWTKVFHGTEACTVPVLTPREAGKVSGSLLPEPHPSIRNHSVHNAPSPQSTEFLPSFLKPGQHTDEILVEFGVGDDEKRSLGLRDAKLIRTGFVVPWRAGPVLRRCFRSSFVFVGDGK